MGILAKAMRKSQLGAGKAASEEPKPKAPGLEGRQPAAQAPPFLTGKPQAPPKSPPGKGGQPAPSAPGGTVRRPAATGTEPRTAGNLAAAAVRRRAAGDAAPAEASAPPAPVPQAAPEPPPVVQPAARGVAPDLVSLVNPEGPEAELFKLLRSRILFPQSGHPPRTILVTSSLPEEGKSFIAANLAVNFAKNVDEHVLLVDCDLRKPSIHTRFGFNSVKGLSEYLAAGLALPGLLLKTGVEKLTLLPSGASPSNPSELISSSKMAGLIEELKARYDDRFIILDSPPPMVAPETSAVAKWADGILVVARFGTPMSLVEELIASLDREKIIGVVINRVHQREFRRYSYKKYYRNSRYYPA